MKQETRPVYVADDGTVFSTESEALGHDEMLRKRSRAFSYLKVHRVAHGFDTTEGRGYFAKTLIVTDAPMSVMIQWCLDKFGPPLDSWYGDGFYSAWLLQEKVDGDTVEWAMANKGHTLGYGHRPLELAVVSQKDFTWAGLPKSEWPWPRRKTA